MKKRVCFAIISIVVPKPRPRVTKNGTYLPKKYRDWTDDSIIFLKQQMHRHIKDGVVFPLEKVSKLGVVFFSPSGLSDGDNAIGAVMDVLVKAGVIKNDRMLDIPIGSWEWIKSDKAESGIVIYIELKD